MNLLQLRYFTAVAEELSFRRAAERLHISQPPLSFHIKAMEHSLGTRLFDRTTRAVTLTDAGAVLLERAHRILRLVDDVSEEMQAIAAGAAGALRVGLTVSAAFHAIFYRSIQLYRDAFPNVKLTFTEMFSPLQIDALLEGHLDVGFLRFPDAQPPPGVVALKILEAELVLAVPQSHPVARDSGRVPLTKVKGESFIGYPPRSGGNIVLYQQILRLCEHARFVPRMVQEALEPSLVIGFVAAGAGVAIVPSSLRRIQIPGVVFKPIADKGTSIMLHLAYREGHHNPRIRALVDIVKATPAAEPEFRRQGAAIRTQRRARPHRASLPLKTQTQEN